MNAFTFQAFVTKFIQAPGRERWLDKPIHLLKEMIVRALCIIRRPFESLRKRR